MKRYLLLFLTLVAASMQVTAKEWFNENQAWVPSMVPGGRESSIYDYEIYSTPYISSANVNVDNINPVETVTSLKFSANFNLKWYNYAVRGKGLPSPVAYYIHKRFEYTISIYADDILLGNIIQSAQYDAPETKNLPDPDSGTRAYTIETGFVGAEKSLDISGLTIGKDYKITAKLKIRVSDVKETIYNYNDYMGVVSNEKKSETSLNEIGMEVTVKREAIERNLYQSIEETHAVKGSNGEYWLYNHPDAEFTLSLNTTNIEESTGGHKNFVGFFVGYGDNVSPFGASNYSSDDADYQCQYGKLIYSSGCGSGGLSYAKNREYIELAGDAGVTNCESSNKCSYSIAYGSEAFWKDFQNSSLKDIIVNLGHTCYIKSMCRPRNVLIKSNSLSSYNTGSFSKTNIIDVSTWQGAEGDTYYKNTFHLRDLELNTPLAGEPDYYGRKIKTGDVFNIKAKLYVPYNITGTSYPLAFREETRRLYSFAGFSVGITSSADVTRKYTSQYALSTYRDDGVQTKDMIRLRVVPAAKFPSLSTDEKAVRVVCGTNVPDSLLINEDVIHIISRELTLSSGYASLSQYNPIYYWEYNTVSDGSSIDPDAWRRIDNDPSIARFVLQPENLDFVESYNDRDLFIKSTVLLENGKFRPGKKVYFRQCATLTTFSSANSSKLYADKIGDKYCIKVTSSDYYTYMARPSLNKENLITKGADTQILCWGDNIDTKNDSVKFYIAMGGDIQTEDLLRQSREIAQYWAVRHAGGDSTEMKHLKVSGDTCRFRMQYYPTKEDTPTDGDTIRYVMYIATCRDTVKKEFSIITYPKDRINVDDLMITKDGYVSSRDNIKDTILINAVRGSAPELVVNNANKEFYNYQWHTKTRITDYEGSIPLVIDFTYYSQNELVDFVRNVRERYFGEDWKNYYYLQFYTQYSKQKYGYAKETSFDDPNVPMSIQRDYAQFCLEDVNRLRKQDAEEEFVRDNSWKEFDSQVTEPLVILQPHGKYLTMDENYFFIRRVGRGGSPTGQSCNSDSVRVTIKYFDPISKDSIEFEDKSDSINVRVGDAIPRIVGSIPTGGYGNPANTSKDVSYKFFWQWSLDGYNDWQTIEKINGDLDYYLQRRGDSPTQRQNGVSLKEGQLIAEQPKIYIRRVIWSMIGTNEESKVEHFSNHIVVTTAKMLDPDKVFHYGHEDYDRQFGKYSVCSGETDEIYVDEPNDILSEDIRYVWDVRHFDDKSPLDFTTESRKRYYPNLQDLCRITNDGRDYYYDVYRLNAKDGSRSNVVSDTIHVNKNNPLFKFRSSMDDYLTLHDVNDEDYILTNGTRVKLYDNSDTERKREYSAWGCYWSLQVQDFIEGAQPLASYTSYKEEPQLVLYNTGENKIQLTVLSVAYSKDCYSKFTGSIYVAAPENGRTRGASAFIDEEDGDEYKRMDGSDYIDVFPTALSSDNADIIHIRTNYAGYSVRLFDSIGRILYNVEDLTGDYDLPVSLTKGTYIVYIDGKRFKVLVK